MFATTAPPVNRYPVLSDSDVYMHDEGYERTVILAGWDPNNERRIAKVEIRVDRVPDLSYATLSIWNPDTGWNQLVKLPHESFWPTLPGFTRGGNDDSRKLTLRLAADLARDAELIASAGEV